VVEELAAQGRVSTASGLGLPCFGLITDLARKFSRSNRFGL
jgi:hypothetical protein